MSALIQSLESRVLFSGTAPLSIGADELKLLSDLKTIQSDVQHCAPMLSGGARSVAADLRKLPASASNRSLLAAFRADEKNCVTTIRRDVASIVRTGGSDAKAAVAQAVRVFFDPSNTAARTKLAATLTRLQGSTAAPLASLTSDITSCQSRLTKDLDAISAANPSDAALKSDVAGVESAANTCLTTAQADRATLQSDLNGFIHDLTAAG